MVILRQEENCARKKKFWRHVDRRKKKDRKKKIRTVDKMNSLTKRNTDRRTYFHEGNTEEENNGYVVFK
jgi:hypothetical protein